MTCSPTIENNNNVDEYVQASEKINSVNLEPKDNNDCANFSNQHAKSFTEIGKNICEQFLKLYKSLPNLKNNISNGSCSKKNCGFLNYWLNFELKKHNQNTCVNVFHNGIESQCNNTIDNILPNNVIYNIDEDHLYKIDKLYNLYSNYTKLKAIIGSSLEKDKQERLQLSTKCCADYNEVSYICKDDNKNNEDNIEFCEKLDIFKNNYEKLYTQLGEEGSEISNSFKKLTECGNTRIIATAILGSVAGIIPLMGGLYKFTPIGQIFRPKNRNITKGHRNNGDEMRNISLMEHEREELRIHQGLYNIKYQSV